MVSNRTLFYVACPLFWLPLGRCATPFAKADAPVATLTSRSVTIGRDQADVFASRFRVVSIDLAGQDDSGRERAHRSVVGLTSIFSKDSGPFRPPVVRKPARAAPRLAAVQVDAVGERIANRAVND